MHFVDNADDVEKDARCSARVTILADGRECPEYCITGDIHGNLKCYIPLMSDQNISVQVAMNMNSEHFEVDFFADGVIRNFWQSTRNPVNKHRAPSVEFTQGIYKTMRSLFRSNMTTVPIPEDADVAGAERTDVGCIEVMINKKDQDCHYHHHGFMVPDDVPKSWYNQAAAVAPTDVQPSLQLMFKDGIRMQEADRGGTRLRLRRTRQGNAPWATFKFIYREREQLRAAGILNPARMVYGNSTPLGPLTGSRKRARPDDRSVSPESNMRETRQHVQDLRTEVLELQIQADRAKRIRVEKEKETERLAREARQEWAELELTKSNLERQIAEETTKFTAQEEEQAKLRGRFLHSANAEGHANANVTADADADADSAIDTDAEFKINDQLP
ncbi:MAG: hypothetical protein Q9219_004921 [cf. Caloplaca sp. 3 TL-2023]